MKRPFQKLQTKWTCIFRNKLWGLWMLLPGMAGVMLFRILPLTDVLRRSFCGQAADTFIGLQNYRAVLDSASFRLAAGNTLLFLVSCVPILLVLSLALACLSGGAESAKTAFLMPMTVPVACIVLVWRLLFARYGLLDGSFGAESGTDYLNGGWAFWVLVATYLWRNIGYDTVLWAAAFHSVDPCVYEAAEVDGADRIQKFRYITLPCILPYAGVILILSVLNAFKVFREVYLISGEYPDKRIYLLQHLFNNWLADLKLPRLCAGAMLVLPVVGAAALLFRKALDRDIYD